MEKFIYFLGFNLFISCLPLKNKNLDSELNKEETGSDASEQPRVYEFFETSEPLILDIKADFATMFDQKNDVDPATGKRTLFDAKVSYPQIESQESLPATLQVRGRSSLENCNFPKLRMRFKNKSMLANTIFSGLDDYKINTHCDQIGPEIGGMTHFTGERALIREYALMQLWEILQPEGAIKSRLVKVNYKNSNDELIAQEMALFVEDGGDTAKRVGGKEWKLDTPDANIHIFDSVSAINHTLFQIFAANRDWSFYNGGLVNANVSSEGAQNIVGVRMLDNTYIVMPQDLDLAGMVSKPKNPVDIFGISENSGMWLGEDDPEQREIYQYVQKVRRIYENPEAFIAVTTAWRDKIPIMREYIESSPLTIAEELFLHRLGLMEMAVKENFATTAMLVHPDLGKINLYTEDSEGSVICELSHGLGVEILEDGESRTRIRYLESMDNGWGDPCKGENIGWVDHDLIMLKYDQTQAEEKRLFVGDVTLTAKSVAIVKMTPYKSLEELEPGKGYCEVPAGSRIKLRNAIMTKDPFGRFGLHYIGNFPDRKLNSPGCKLPHFGWFDAAQFSEDTAP